MDRIHGRSSGDIHVALTNLKHRTSREYDVHRRIVVVDILDTPLPILVFMYFIQDEMGTAVDIMILNQVVQAVSVEPNVVKRSVKDLAVIGERLLDMLLEERGFSHALRAFDADYPRLPVDMVIYLPFEIKANLGHQSVRISVKYIRIQFHNSSFLINANIQNNLGRLKFTKKTILED